MYTWLTCLHGSPKVVCVVDYSWDDERARAFGHQLQRYRIAAGLPQEKVAIAAGLSRNHYQLLEQGLSDRAKGTRANPRIETLIGLSKVFDISLEDMIAGLSEAE